MSDPLAYLDQASATIDTPENTYQRFQVRYVDGALHIIARSGHDVVVQPGILTVAAPRVWTLTTDTGDVWTIDRARGCNCRGQPIIPK